MAIFKKLKWFSFCVFVCTLLMPNDSSVWAKEECKGIANSKDCKGSSNSRWWKIVPCKLLKFGRAVAGGIAAVPDILRAMGFTDKGIIGGSLAAKLFSSTAARNGGAVPAGSLVSILQKVGAKQGYKLTSDGIVGKAFRFVESWLPNCEDDAVQINENDGKEELSVDELCKIWDLIKELQNAGQDQDEESRSVDFGAAVSGFNLPEETSGGHEAFTKFESLKPHERDQFCNDRKKIHGEL